MSVASSPSEYDGLEVDLTLGDDHACLHLVGEFDMSTASVFDEAVALAEAHGPTMLVIDLAGITFIDSSGLNRLVMALKRQRERSGEVVLRSPRPSTLRVLEMVGLTKLFTVVV